MGLPGGLFWLLAVFLLINSDYVKAQSKRNQSPRAGPSSRSLGSNPRTSSSSSVEFDCPEEFGYYPHPTDCSQYYVCVFGGALLESCTGGLMYSHELQTCDWPRNVGCEVAEVSSQTVPAPRDVTPRVPNKFRFSSNPEPSQQQQQQQQIQQQQQQIQREPQQFQREPQQIQREPSAPAHIQQIQSLPPPPELKIAPNPIITSRGQPKDEIIKIYVETSDTLSPAEEEESDRQNRVGRRQPGTVGQVQLDRDGVLLQSSVNAIPTQNKVGSFSANANIPQYTQYRVEQTSPSPSYNVQPQKTVIYQQQPQSNKNYYNTSSNYNYDPYGLYDDYEVVDYQSQYNQQQQQQQQQKSTPSTTYRPQIVSTTPAPKPQTLPPQTYVTTKTAYERPIYDYDEALIAQIEEDARYGQDSDIRGDRNELNSLSDRAIIKLQPSIRTNSPKYSSPAYVSISTPVPFSYTPTVRTTTRTTTTTTTTTTTKRPVEPQYVTTRQPNRNRGSSPYSNGDVQSTASYSRGTHPPRARPTLKPAQNIVSKAQEFVDIYRHPPTRPEPLYPQPIPDKTAAKCRKDVCLLPDCYCGGKDIPGDLPIEQVPQIVLLTFDDSVNDLNKQLYSDLFERGRVNPNGCPISATFYVSHEWTDYSQVQNLYSDGHEMASHTVSHSFGEQFSLKKWAREIAGQREILSAYGGVKLEDIRGMRAPFLSIGGNKMFKMLHDFNFTYDSSMPVYENRPPSWPYTLDYKIFHDCMIPPCPTKSYPGVWEVPMVMWQDLNGGRCSMGDACSNPSDAEGVTKMIMKNFERHYTTNRSPFGLFYHAAWFTQPHHKEGFIKFLDTINAMKDVYIVTNWQALQWVRDPTPLSRINSFQPFQCNYQDRPKRCNNPKVCNLWHKSGVRYMRTCQPCPEIYPWTGKSGIRSSRIDNDLEVVEST